MYPILAMKNWGLAALLDPGITVISQEVAQCAAKGGHPAARSRLLKCIALDQVRGDAEFDLAFLLGVGHRRCRQQQQKRADRANGGGIPAHHVGFACADALLREVAQTMRIPARRVGRRFGYYVAGLATAVTRVMTGFNSHPLTAGPDQ